MLDFSSALYLGLRHSSSSLRPWAALSLGKPAALQPPPGAAAVAAELAQLQGCERGVLLPSTLHLFWDLFGIMARDAVRIYLDSGAYPIPRWGVERAAAAGVPVRPFPHHDSSAARRAIEQDRHTARRPVIVADGYCPGCGGPAPLERYLRCVAPYDGYLVLDDTQALGIFGEPRQGGAAYGSGGGGSLRHQGLRSANVIAGSSLAKAFGVPVSVLCGSAALLRRFDALSETRVHASPPSIAVIRAAERALEVNRQRGDALRQRLARLVDYFRGKLRQLGLRLGGGVFPMQTLAPDAAVDPAWLHQRLLAAGIRAVLHRDRLRQGARLSFLITAAHRFIDIDHVAAALASAFRDRDAAVSAGGRGSPTGSRRSSDEQRVGLRD
jgi:8-amino-7-oxononanoate synthase